MSRWRAWARGAREGRALVVVAIGAASLVACVVDHHHPDSWGGSAPAAGGGTGSPTGPAPMLVDVDTNQTLTVNAGEGVGVFTEYRAGGHWHIWWTCDTRVTGLSCTFRVDVTVATGAIANLAGEQLESGDQLGSPGPQEALAVTTTTTESDGMTFDTDPGAVITLDAQVNGQRTIDGTSFLFFAQSGQPNGGYTGPVANPLMLEPSAP